MNSASQSRFFTNPLQTNNTFQRVYKKYIMFMDKEKTVSKYKFTSI